MSNGIIQAQNLSKFFMVGTGVRALRKVSLDVRRGEFLAITGPSGCGKSTLLSLLGGLARPTYGEIWLDGTPYSSLSENELAGLRRESIGFVFQFFNLLPDLTALENVLLPFRLQDRKWDESREQADRLLASVGLSERASHRPHQLSGGEQQRVAVARALAGSPAVLLADEPTGNLDSSATAGLMDILRDMNHSGQTVVVVSHDPVVVSYAHRVVLMEDGLIIGEERVT